MKENEEENHRYRYIHVVMMTHMVTKFHENSSLGHTMDFLIGASGIL